MALSGVPKVNSNKMLTADELAELRRAYHITKLTLFDRLLALAAVGLILAAIVGPYGLPAFWAGLSEAVGFFGGSLSGLVVLTRIALRDRRLRRRDPSLYARVRQPRSDFRQSRAFVFGWLRWWVTGRDPDWYCKKEGTSSRP